MKPNFQKDLPHLKSVDRLSKIPVFETGYNFATDLYQKIKKSNGLITWSFNSAEAGFMLAVEISLPAVSYLENPIHTFDKILCHSLDIVEERVPAINYPPDVIYHKTKDYVSTKVVQPVLKRADSVKQISLHNASKYGEMAASRLDNALDVADKYVDKYLPDVCDNPSDTTDSKAVEVHGGSKTAQTIDHVNRLSRKLQRRLTRRTIAEAKALKQQSADTLQCLIYLADLLARDPKAFMEKARKMWEHLSEDEPENQVPPANLEQLIAMLTREVARRVVHLVNYTGAIVSQMPHCVGNIIHVAAHNIYTLADFVLKKLHLESMIVAAVAQAKLLLVRAQEVLKDVKNSVTNLLDYILRKIVQEIENIQSYNLSSRKQITSSQKPHQQDSSSSTSPGSKNSSASPKNRNSNSEQKGSQKTSKNNSPKEQQNQEKNNSTPPSQKFVEQEKCQNEQQEGQDGKNTVK